MGSFFIGLVRSGSVDEVRARLRGLDVEVSGLMDGYTPPVMIPTPEQPRAIDGAVDMGRVRVIWSNGIPLKAYDLWNENRWAIVPSDLWETIRNGGAPAEDWLKWLYLAFLESDYVPAAHNLDGEDSWGAWQVNRDAWPMYSVEELSTYEGNMAAALAIYAVQGWGAWYNSARDLGLIIE